jgi:hypothetical protein
MKIYPEDSIGPEDFILDEFPRDLNPELYKSDIDWEEEERKLKKEQKRRFFKNPFK